MAVYKRGDKWVADFYLGGRNGRRVRKSAATKVLAVAIERDAKLKEFTGVPEESKAQEIRLHPFLKKYKTLHESGNETSTQKRDTYVFNKLKEILGNPWLHHITREDIESYKAKRRKKVKPVTVNLELRVIRSLFNRAKEWNYIKRSPVDGVKKFRLDEHEPRFLVPSEGKALISACEGQIRSFIITALNTGLRKGELFNLKWQDINFDRGEIRVRKAKGKKYRVIPLNKMTTKNLESHPRHPESPFVFHNSDGSPRRDIRNAFNAALRNAKLPHIRIHDLRHSFISNLVMAGEDLRAVQELAGHRNISTTMRYAHLAPGRLKSSIERLQWT